MTRSFTLLETIVAAALLAMLAASAISALRSITLAADRAGETIDVGAFSLIVDDLLADSPEYGLPQLTDGATWDGLVVRHPEHAAKITIRRTAPQHLAATTPGAPPRRHAWLIFESGGAAVARWLPLPEQEQQP